MMNRLSCTLALFLSSPLIAQTATTQPQVVTTTAPIILAGTTLCSVPKNGGPCRVAQAIALAPLKATVPGQTAPVSLKGASGSFTCTVPMKLVPVVQVDASGNPAGTVYVLAYSGTAPPALDTNGNVSVPGTSCTLVTQ